MDEKALKTSVWQRVVIIVVAVLLLGSTVLTYMFIVMNSNSSKKNTEERIAALEAEYTAKQEEYAKAAEALSPKYFDTLKPYLSQIKSFNAASANSAKLQIKDLKEGDGTKLGEKDSNYMAYYIGWCPDGSLLDSSFNFAEDDATHSNPLSLKQPIFKPSNGSMIDGWEQGVVGMKLGGVRWLSIPGEMAYGDSQGDKYCGMSNAPLRYVVMALPTDTELDKLNTEANDIYYRLYTAYYGSQS